MSSISLRRVAHAWRVQRRALCGTARYYGTGPSGLEARGEDTASLKTLKVHTLSRTYFSGIQPTGVPHLGNYLGALRNWVKLQREAAPHDTLYFSIVGWHALTLPQDRKVLLGAQTDMMALLLAIGLDPKRSIIFHQSQNPNHLELAWYLNCITPVGKLRRMTTWKGRLADSRNANDESEVDDSLLNTGLFTYPVLQAADILLYKATHVPVGEDQQQHIELCRDLAEIFNRQLEADNKTFRATFPLPAPVYTPSKRILSLRDPTSKMSKSSPIEQSRILLTDSPEEIKAKIRRAVTDSVQGITYDPVNRPGTSNLLTILAACENTEPEQVADLYSGKDHGHLKSDVIDAVVEMLRRPREEYERLIQARTYLTEVAQDGLWKAKLQSEQVMRTVRERLGMLATP
ncbi:tryptophanyl-tRNA synthetase [Neolentinus lepideus HHB14362 ss-1]|uniref:tryptophan--tRNA ligase n=1 Tax=Neolentinus lepideus HHB14362 ss-1 TaxID=1314782 RepID=A0A165MVD9_9AGAM|nr:tryptophanyl-tRNA synthetase [Neolentinus lepideus HHB14362 ss-1]